MIRFGERGRLSREALYEIGRRDDRDLSEWVEREQIGVAGDDQIGMAVYRQFQEFVVLRITARDDPLNDPYQFGPRDEFAQPIPKARRDQRCKTRPSQRDKQLLLGDHGLEEQTAFRHDLDCRAWRRFLL